MKKLKLKNLREFSKTQVKALATKYLNPREDLKVSPCSGSTQQMSFSNSPGLIKTTLNPPDSKTTPAQPKTHPKSHKRLKLVKVSISNKIISNNETNPIHLKK